MTDFDDIDENDAADAVGKLASIKVPWNTDVEYFFFELENQMELVQLKSQWLKRVVLANNLPEQVKDELKATLKKTKSTAPAKVYKVLKTKIFALFGPKEGDKYEKALQLQLTGKPSALAKQLAELLCKCDPPLSSDDCCALDTVAAMWRRSLPQVVKSAVAGRSLKGPEFDRVIQTADDVFASISTIAPVAATATDTVDADEATDEVAAFRQGRNQARGRGAQSRGASRARQRGGRWSQSTGNRNQSRGRGPRHPDIPPENSCQNHWTYGRGTHNCTRDHENCPWKHITVQQPSNQNY